MLNGSRLSVVTGCRDRTNFLLQALPTWIAAEQIDEIVIVDWSSTIPLQSPGAGFAVTWSLDPRTILATVPNQAEWHLSKCCNLGLAVATGDIILRLDSDVLLDPRFFEDNELCPGRFRAGIYDPMLPFPLGLWGALLAYKSDILSVNGYNERLIGYGWDDEDLYQRLSRSGIERAPMNHRHLTHIPHGVDLRLGTQKGSLDQSSARNRLSMVDHPWTTSDHVTKWSMNRRGNVVTCMEDLQPEHDRPR